MKMIRGNAKRRALLAAIRERTRFISMRMADGTFVGVDWGYR